MQLIMAHLIGTGDRPGLRYRLLPIHQFNNIRKFVSILRAVTCLSFAYASEVEVIQVVQGITETDLAVMSLLCAACNGTLILGPDNHLERQALRRVMYTSLLSRLMQSDMPMVCF